MIFRPSRTTKVTMIFILFCPIIACYVMFFDNFTSYWYPALFMVITLPVCFNYCITVGRTIIMSKEGCFVKFLCFQKEYPWESLCTKRYEEYCMCLPPFERGSPYTHGVLFSPHTLRKNNYIKAATRAMLSPFSFSYIYVYFYPNNATVPPNFAYPVYYAANEQTFREKMKLWGVIVEKPIER